MAPMSTLGRRKFLVHGSLTAAGASLPFAALWSRRARARDYGELIPDPAGILDLPTGFSYTILEEAGQPMDDNYVVPGRPDGMACFPGAGGTVVLMRNHEAGLLDVVNGAYGLGEAPPEAYNDLAFGGVTRVVLDANDFSRISSNLVLTGTNRNCAGGPSPWGWLSCEESVSATHGYVFVCSTEADTVAMPERVEGYGHFNHEAAAVDPDTLYCYLTEDRGDSCLYRFVPDDPGDPFTGTLQALRVVGQDNLDTDTGLNTGDMLDIEWVDLTEPNPVNDTVRVEAASLGAAIFSRGEGIWMFEDEIYFTCTNGGPAGLGQIFRLIDDPVSPTLELIAQSEDSDVLDAPDNITVAPWGQVFVAEDGGGQQFIRAISDKGDVISFARNAISDSEFAGVCFSPDGRAMFVNIQGDGLTLVVTGPFPEVPPPDDGTGTGTGDSTGDDTTGDSTGAPADSTGGEAGSAGESGVGSTSGNGVTSDVPGGSSEGSTGDTAGQGDDGGQGCGCSSTDPSPAAAVVVGALALGLRTRGPAED